MALPLPAVRADETIQFAFDLISEAFLDLRGIYHIGTGSPNGVVTASPPAFYLNRSGGAGATFWVKESGTNTNTGWVAK